MDKLKGAIPVLIIINVIFFGITYAMGELQTSRMISLFGLFFPMNPNFEIWQFVTNMFMHGGFMHIFLNMYALWAFGSPLELIWGRNRFLIFYFVSGIGAAVVYTIVNYVQFNTIHARLIADGISEQQIQSFLYSAFGTTIPSASPESLETLKSIFRVPVVGASGAIYGVLVAFGMLFPNSKLMLIFLPFPIAAKYFIPILIAIDLFSGITGFSIFGGGIAHFGHIGGALIGFLLMLLWRNNQRRQQTTMSDGYNPGAGPV